jgi:hypothetical protein
MEMQPVAKVKKGLFLGEEEILIIVNGGKFEDETENSKHGLWPDGLWKSVTAAEDLYDAIKELDKAGYKIFFI